MNEDKIIAQTEEPDGGRSGRDAPFTIVLRGPPEHAAWALAAVIDMHESLTRVPQKIGYGWGVVSRQNGLQNSLSGFVRRTKSGLSMNYQVDAR